MLITKDEIEAMTMAEKHKLLDMLWDSLEEIDYIDNADEETTEEKQLLRERLQDYQTNPASGVDWEKLKEEVRKRYHD